MIINTTTRSLAEEIMDDFSMEGELLRKTLDKIAWINKWLGGNKITIRGLKELLSGVSKDNPITIVDLGCGSGDMLRIVADYARKNNYNIRLTGIDANAFTIAYARKLSLQYPEISYIQAVIPSSTFDELNYDIILATLFLHHFKEPELFSLMSTLHKKARIGMVINDLHRSKWAYILFQLLTIFIPNPMVRKDGCTSILRGFKKPELESLAKDLQLKNTKIRWRWAFRYQWTISKVS